MYRLLYLEVSISFFPSDILAVDTCSVGKPRVGKYMLCIYGQWETLNGLFPRVCVLL